MKFYLGAFSEEQSILMPCKKKYKRVRAVDVGRPGHHYLQIGIRSTRGPRGGLTEAIGGLKLYKRKRR